MTTNTVAQKSIDELISSAEAGLQGLAKLGKSDPLAERYYQSLLEKKKAANEITRAAESKNAEQEQSIQRPKVEQIGKLGSESDTAPNSSTLLSVEDFGILDKRGRFTIMFKNSEGAKLFIKLRNCLRTKLLNRLKFPKKKNQKNLIVDCFIRGCLASIERVIESEARPEYVDYLLSATYKIGDVELEKKMGKELVYKFDYSFLKKEFDF